MTTRFTDHLLSGTYANLPDPSATPVGALFVATDVAMVYKNDGTAWAPWAPPGVLPIDQGATVPATTPVGTIIVQKA